MADEEQKPAENETASQAGQEDATTAAPGASIEAEPPAPEESPTTGERAADAVWEPFDTVLQAFGQERGAGLGTFWGESPAAVEGRFASWANASGWRCTLQLVRAPEENAVVLVAQGPPLPGGRARMMLLGAFPPEFEQDTLRAALEVGYGIGETWGPTEEPPHVPPPSPEPSGEPSS